MATYSFDKTTKIIEVDLPDTEIQIQELIDVIRSWEDELSPAMDITRVADAAGKDDLGGGVLVGITLTLREGWRLKFADRPGPDWVTCNVFGGNLVATDENDDASIAIAPAEYVNTNTQGSQSPSIQSLEIEELKYRIESQRGKNAAYGNVIYWSPYDGNDTNDGGAAASPKKTIEAALSAFTNPGDGDVIWMLANDPAGITTVSANVVLSADHENLQFRGPGSEFIMLPIDPDLPIFDIRVNGVGFEAFQLSGEGASAGSGDGFFLSGVAEYHMADIRVANVGGVGVHIKECSRGVMQTIDVISNDGAGIIFHDSSYCEIQGNTVIHYNGYPGGGNGVTITGSHGIHFVDSMDIHNNNGYGIYVDPTSQETFIHPDSRLFSNVSGNTLDEGTEGYIGRSLGTQITEDIKFSVESNRDEQAGYGNFWYWDPYSGDDADDGANFTRPVSSWARVNELIVDGRGDVVIAMATNPTGATVVNEQILINKNNVSVRGPGQNFQVINTASGIHSIYLQAVDNVDVSNIYAEGRGTSAHTCYIQSCTHAAINNCTFEDAWNDNIYVQNSEYIVFNTVELENAGRHGITLDGVDYTDILGRTIIHYNGDHGILLTGSHGINIGESTNIHDNNGYGIYIDTASYEVVVQPSIHVFYNGLGDVFNGSNDPDQVFVGENIGILTGLPTQLSAYKTSGVAGVTDLSGVTGTLDQSAVSAAVNQSLSAYETTGVASKFDVTGTSATVDLSAISGVMNESLSAYESTGVASKIDINNITGVSATIPLSSLDYIVTGVVSGSSGAVISGIGAWGDLRWSKIYGIPLQQWDVIVLEEDEDID